MRRAHALPALAAAALLACAGKAGAPLAIPGLLPAAPASIQVELLQGFATPQGDAPPERVEILVDVSQSMQADAGAGVPAYQAALAAASRLIESLPKATAVGVSAVGARAGECRSSRAVGSSRAGKPRRSLLEKLGELEPKGEGSLAGSLDILAAGLGSEKGAWHVAVFSDLDQQCGGDLCQAVDALVSAGARLELVAIGEAPVPDCVRSFAFRDAPAPARRPGPPRFRVEATPSGGGKPVTVLRGRADGAPLELPAGTGTLVLDLDPPARIGPLLFSPAALTRVRVIDFPQLGHRVREWRWDTVPLEVAQESP